MVPHHRGLALVVGRALEACEAVPDGLAGHARPVPPRLRSAALRSIDAASGPCSLTVLG
jgi:hypothetical protein